MSHESQYFNMLKVYSFRLTFLNQRKKRFLWNIYYAMASFRVNIVGYGFLEMYYNNDVYSYFFFGTCNRDLH